jgi:LacI family transcriptional regulator
MKKSISIHDIAKHLNVSAATVSFVLNGKADQYRIRPEVVERINRYVKEVGYRPNLVAKSLRTGKTKLIGMLVEGISDPFFSSIARIVEAEAYKAGYKLFYSSTDNDTEKARALIKAFQERQVDGYIIAPTPGIENDIQNLLDGQAPVILFDRYLPSLQTTNIVIDNYNGVYDAMEHLFQSGYQNIGFVTIESEQVQMLDRLRGYADFIEKRSKKACVAKVAYSLAHHENVAIIKSFLTANSELDAVLFATNYLTIAGLQSIKELQLSVPEDIGVVSFDDNSHFELFSPSISAIAQPVEEMSHEIIRQLKLRLVNSALRNESFVLKPQFIQRESSLPKEEFTIKTTKTNPSKSNGSPVKQVKKTSKRII